MSLPGEGGSAKLSLDEELRVEDGRGRVKGETALGGVDVVGSSHGVARYANPSQYRIW